MIETSRRSLLVGLGVGLIAAPAIVRASSLMKIKPFPHGWVVSWWNRDEYGIITRFDPYAWHPVTLYGHPLCGASGAVIMQRLADGTGDMEYEWKRAT